MNDEPDKRARAHEPGKPVPLSKGPAHADDVSAERPRTVVAAVAALGVSALSAFGAAISLYGQRSWLTGQTIKSNHDNISSAVSSAVASASSARANVPSASASASSSAAARWPTTAAHVHNSVTQQQTSGLLVAIVFAAALGFLGSGMYRGRHWSRWGIVVFWVLATLSTPYGIFGLFLVRSSAPGAYKAFGFAAALLLLVAVVLANLRSSTEYFALTRPARTAAPARRGLFAPRPPAGPQRSGSASATERAKSALTSSAASRGEAYVEKQRAKKRAAANRDSIARGAELARSRAKASKSRRIEPDRRHD